MQAILLWRPDSPGLLSSELLDGNMPMLAESGDSVYWLAAKTMSLPFKYGLPSRGTSFLIKTKNPTVHVLPPPSSIDKHTAASHPTLSLPRSIQAFAGPH